MFIDLKADAEMACGICLLEITLKLRVTFSLSKIEAFFTTFFLLIGNSDFSQYFVAVTVTYFLRSSFIWTMLQFIFEIMPSFIIFLC